MTITLIHTAPEPLLKNYIGRLHGNPSMARGYADALSYAKTIGFDAPRYEPVYGPLLERLKSDKHAFAKFSVAHAEELRAERDAESMWQSQRAWAKTGRGYAEVSAANKAAFDADQLERAINERGTQLLRAREAEARQAAFADARAQLGGSR
jgi:hypothetical protein